LKTLAELEQADPDSALVQQALGYQALRDGELPKALEHLRRSIELDPQVALNYAYLSEALKQNNEIDAAITTAEKAVSLEPYNPLLQKALIDRLLAAKQPRRAEAALERYLEVFPQDTSMRELLHRVRQ
jgi:predicted Zn-dependent protease